MQAPVIASLLFCGFAFLQKRINAKLQKRSNGQLRFCSSLASMPSKNAASRHCIFAFLLFCSFAACLP